MKVIVINQEPLEVTPEQGMAIVEALRMGTQFVTINGEYIKASVITGVRNDNNDHLPKTAWGMLPQGSLKHFFNERREQIGSGYERYKSIRKKLGI